MSAEDLSSVLWRERDLLEMLLFKLEVEQLVLTSGRTHWLALAAREVENVLQDIRDVEMMRAMAVDAVAAELGLEPNASLNEIAQGSEEPWRSIWFDHREAFTTVATQISEMSQSNRVLLTAGYQAAQATLLSLTEKSATYGSDGSMGPDRRTGLVDRNL
jgi:hypothetical protein